MTLNETHPVILAGGLGTRLRGVIRDVPKPLAPVRGRPFLEWVMRFLAAEGLRAATISTGYLGEAIARHFAGRPIAGVAVDCVAEDRALGTAGGFLNATRRLGRAPSAWLVLNGDSLIFADLAALAGRLERSGAEAALVARRVEDAARYGRLVVGPDGRLVRFSEKRAEAAGPGLVNAGVYLLRAATLERFPAGEPLSFEEHVFPSWLGSGIPIAVLESDAPFLDIGTEEDYGRADAFIARHEGKFA